MCKLPSFFQRLFTKAAASMERTDNEQRSMNALSRCETVGGVITGKYAPLHGKRLFMVGQDLDTVKSFVSEVLPNPAGTTTYTALSTTSECLHGLDASVDYGAGNVCASQQAALVPHSVLNIGLALNGALDSICKQQCDADIERLGCWIRTLSRPVFLRIGYEFDGSWNGYDPELYKVVFRRIVSHLRALNVCNFVSVWHSATHEYWPESRFLAWYPGDDVVDWMGTTYFSHGQRTAHDAFLNFARAQNKPVMVAECAPQGYDLGIRCKRDFFTGALLQSHLTGQQIWRDWFKPFLKYIDDNRDVIRAIAYINTPWKTQSMWQTDVHYWGDSRIQANDCIKRRFLKELSKEHWILASPYLLSKIELSETPKPE